MHRTLSLTLLAIALAAAEEAPTIIVTAERGESELERAPVSVNVVEAAQIRDRGYALGQTDWLRELPGVIVLGNNGGMDGGTARISLRGVDPSFNAVLLDGIPIHDGTATDGLLNPAMLNPAGTGRIEVLKGAQSGLYGSGAVGGVIDIISIRPTEQAENRVRLTGGSFETGQFEVAATGPAGSKVGYAFGASGTAAEGFSSATGPTEGSDPGDHEPDSLHRISAIGRVEVRPVEGLMLYGAGMVMNSRQGFDTYPPPTYASVDPEDNESESEVAMTRASAGGEWKRGGTTVSVDAAKTWVDRLFKDSGDPGDDQLKSNETWFSLRLRQELGAGFRVGLGGDDRQEEGRQHKDGVGTRWDDSTGQHGGYALIGWSGTHGEASVTGRLDDHEAYGSQTGGRAAAAIFTEDLRWKLRGAIGDGFVAPTLYQLHGQFPPYSFAGNPDLEPQTAEQYEIGTDIEPVDDVTLSATVFRTMYDKRITYYTDMATFDSTYVNGASDEEVSGLELGFGLRDIAAAGIDLDGWYTHLDSDDGKGKPSMYTPEDTAGMRITARQQHGDFAWWQSLGGQYTQGLRTGTNRYADSFTVVDAAVGLLYAQRWEAVLRIENALDEAYEINPPYTTAPRAFYLSLGAKF